MIANRLKKVEEYYFSKKLREVRQLIAEGKPIINIGIGSPDLEPPVTVVEALQKSLQQGDIHGYQSYQGLPELRGAIATFYKQHYNVTLDPNNEILPLMGSKEGIMHISMAFLNPGDQVLVPNPGYPTYLAVSNMVEADPIRYALKEENNWFPDLESLERIDLSKVKLMWVNYPHMPSGQKATRAQLEKLIAFAKTQGILLVNDNPYSMILTDEPMSIFQIEGAKEVCLELNSLSKTFNMAGWRVGMVVGALALIQSVLQIKSNMDSGMFYGIQQGAIAALKSSTRWFENLNHIYSQRRSVVWKIMDRLGATYDKNAVGLFVWAKLPEGQKAEEIADELLYTYNVFLTPGTVFGSLGEGYIRISLCVEESVLLEVLNRLN
ncbi:aminotransferase class I/II-fold pyridoxal phosphate-dependent enzyme [Flavobacteriaceae bacterium F08102]|nr:aminotransferase class I/II-fold pyridoxal phosphate-dependent enzyme [Flavobacteriaceae bacterium F08102]